MTIQLTLPPSVRPFRAFEDPALPDGYWVAHGSVLGDGSGGLMSVNIRFSSATEPNVSTLWNLEQLMIDTTNLSRTVRMDAGNMDRQPIGESTGALSKLWQLALIDFGTAAAGAGLDLDSQLLPLFLGRADKGVAGDLAFDLDNVTGTSFAVMAQGFFWGPGAVNAPGGPQRPVGSLFGR